jgi:hypothetical protein
MATLIDDATATEYFNGIENAPEDKRQQMADDLLAWGNAKQEQEYNDADKHFSKLFTDQAYFEQEKAANVAVQESIDPDQTAKSAAIGAWLEHRTGRPVDTMSYQVERDAFAMANYGQKNLDDAQFFDFVSGEYETQQKKTEALNDLHMQSVGKAINDSQLGQNRPFVDGMTDVFNQWQQKYPELVDGTNDAAFLSQGYKLYYDTINDLDSVRPQAAQTLSTLEKFTKGESDPESLQTLSNTLIGATPEERQKIYKYVTLAAEAGHIDRAGLDQFALNMGQAFTRGFDFVPQGSLQMQEAGVNNWLESIRNGTQIWVPADGNLSKAEVGNAPEGVESDAWRQATLPETEKLIQSGHDVREGFKVVRELRNVAKTGVDPIRPVLEENSFWGTAERGAYGLAGSIAPMAATAVNPFLGALAYQATEYDRIMLENSDINPQFAQGLALVEGVANAAIDRVQLKSLSGKLPMFGRYLDRIKSDGIRRTVKIGANVVEQNLQEGAQDLIAPVLETAVAALREDMPDKDFSSLMEGWAGQRPETFFATLPLALIGGGVASFRDIKHPSAELNATKLRMAGFSPEQTTFIQRAENPEEYDARIQMEFPNRTPENIQAGEELIQQSISEAQNPPENSAKLEETVAKDGTRMWTVTTPDGKELLQTKDQQAALDAIAQHGHAQILNKQFETQYEPEELRQMITDLSTQWTSQDSNNTLVMESEGMNAQQKLEQLQAAGNAAQIQELHNRIANSPMKDSPYEQINILGEASVDDVAEMVFKPLITINPNTRPENLREEIHHTAVKVALKNGSVTLDTLRGWLDATEKALPGTFQNLVRDSEGDIVESLSQVQAAYENGKINADEETKLPPSFINYIKNMMRTLAEVMRRAVALRGAFKDGALPAEYETFLADSVGLNQQARVDTASQRVAGDVLADTDGKVVFSRAQAQSNAGEIRASNATITGPANYSIAAHHGTPHKVDRFSTAKIGTGEGAQAYGWGLYFAEEKKVATGYRDALSGVKLLDAKGEVLVGLTSNPVTQKILKEAQYFWKNGETTLPSIISEITQKKRQAEVWASSGSNVQSNTEFVSGSEEAIRLLQGGSSAKVDGNLYTVDLDVEPEDLLDWDKPFSEQSPKVQAALKAVQSDHPLWKNTISGKNGKPVGGAIYKTLTATWPDAEFSRDGIDPKKKASEALLAGGIPGIRYLDGGSRSDGEGTYNYVAFDENLIRITEENGNRIPASQAIAQPVSTDTNYSIGATQFKGWFGEWDVDPTTASKVIDSDGKPMVVYHGTQRADRVGDRFRKSRATSGPMAFFTNDPAIASSYSTNKRDTSAEMPSDYAEWFKYKGKGMRSPVAIDRAWWNLSPEERAAVNERIYTIGYADADAYEGPIVADSQSIMSRDSIDYELRQARGNGLRALVEMWLSSGSLFNQEERFLEVLQAAGVKGATLDDPNAARSAVYPVYLSIKNPLDTANIPGDVVSALEQAGKRKRAKQSAGGNPDAWDKNTISGNDWMAALKEDMAKGTTHAWTRIPDWVTETLSSFGYDGIKDTGGKHDGVQHQVWIPFNETQVKSATGNRGTFDPTSANINYSIGKKQSAGGIRFDEITKENPKHDGSRVGTAWQGKVRPTTQDTNDGIATVNSKELEKQMAMLTHFVDGVPLPEFITKFQNPEERMRAFIDFQKENLLALYDAFDALSHDYVIRSTHWYDGARLLAEGVRDLYGLTIEQSSAVIAVFSPMKDWFQNVAMGQRFADVMANHKDTQISKATVGNAMSEMLTAAENESDLRKAFKKIKGRSISQLLADKTEEGRKVTAVAVRLMSTHVHGLTHDVLSPEGESLGIRKNLDGTNKKLVWQSYTFIEKAISIYEDGSAKNISKVLGTEHKIRNFYNNIVAPTSPYGDATVDTHAVNAAVLFPMGNKGYLVNLNFGGAGVAGGGNSGTYWLFHEALREAAAARKVMPRQMQSITWEAIRGLFTDVKKRDKNFVANIAKIWQTSQDANSARTQIIKLGITPPEWARVGSANSGIQGGVGKNVGQNANSAGSVQSGVRQGRKGGDGSGGVNYSIASQSEIDRVNKALGGMNRGPDERLKVYQRAKQKFSKLMAWNSDELAAMADTGSDESQIRRTQILQALGELDGILSVLPPEVRGRVGGYTKLAGIAPHDVLKDGVKVSEVSGMNGAIISAWMREGQNIGQAGKQVSLPPGYTATENLSTKRADKVIADFFRDRIKRMDTELEKVLVREYTEAITKVVKQSRPKAGDNGVRKSTLGAETQKFADTVLRATLLDDEATAKRMAEIEAALTMPDATAEDISALSEEWSILNTFGDLDNRSSETLAQGLDWLKGQFQMGREAWRIKEQARIDEQRARNAATIEWLGKGTAKKRNATKTKSELASDLANHYLLSHANFEQFVTAIFPPEIAAKWSDRLRKADEASQTAEIRDRKGILDAVRAGAKAANMSTADAMLWLKADQKNAVSYLEGRKVKDERIAIDLAQKIVTGEADRSKLTDSDVETLRNELAALPADTQKEFVTIKRVIFRGEDVKLDMSRGKAMQYLLSWNQPDVQIKMRKEGWTDDSAADLKALVNDPVSREVMAYAKELYGKGAGIVNPVYSRMFGMNMPQVKNYAPTRFINAKDTKDIGLDGSPSATGTTPGFAKSRVTHSAKIAPEDALNVMQGHIAQQAHWVHFAELAREFRAILSNPEVRESIKQTHGESVLKDAELWADQMEQRGGNKARESTWMNTILGTVLSGKAVSSLGFNLKTLAMQLDNSIRFGLALDMSQIVSALSNPSTIVEDIQTVWESEAIQNRLQGGATAEAKFLFSRYAGKPNFAAKIAEASMTPINWMDSAATSISSAIVYRANLIDALKAGMPEQLAKQTALDAASKAIYQFAQPVSFGQKSIVENNGNVMAKMFFLFMSDARLKTAVLADAARGLATGSGDKGTHIRRILAIETMAVLSHVVSSAFRDGLSDDDDEEIWNLGGFAKAILLAPLQGYFFAGTLGELAISKLTGQRTFNSTTQNPLLSAMEQGVRAGNNLEDAFDLDDPDAMFKEWNNIFRSMALSPAMAAPAVLLNMVKPVMGLYENATNED